MADIRKKPALDLVQFDELADALAAGQLQFRRAPRKEDLEQLAIAEELTDLFPGGRLPGARS